MPYPPGSTSGGEIGVLVCDDVDAIRMLLSVVIGLRAGLRVVGEARDSNEAVSEAKRLQPNIVLLDLSMPHRTGLDALPEIRLVAPAAQIIVLSGFVASTIADHVLALGAVRFIEKGTDPDLIATAIEEVAAQRLTVPAELVPASPN
jgi:two-component system, NarL family, invasion response regulator UvrY